MDLEAAHEKEYWEIPESITRQENNSATSADITATSPPVDLDEPPDHPPLPIPRTIERRPKPTTDVIIETSPTDESLSPSSPGNSADGSVLQSAETNGLSQSPSSPGNSSNGSVPQSNGLTPCSNLEMSRLSFPSDDDLNVTVPMIENPVSERSRPASPTEDNALLETTLM